MKLRVKEICREKGIQMATLAEKLGINGPSLSQCLSGNPTLKRLEEIATILGVGVTELFEQTTAQIQGCIFVGNNSHIIKSKEDLKRLLDEI